jgi:uncharacterized membrane protein YraQ (UPF0718 family)
MQIHHPPTEHRPKLDFMLWCSAWAIVVFYTLDWLFSEQILSINWLSVLSSSVFDLMNTIWWGILIGIIMVAVLTKVPREFVVAVLGHKRGLGGIIRATMGGVLLDLCSHGILMVGAKLYERGASAGQVIAFLVASPWNSFSLTLVLISLIGLKWTAVFVVLSLVIAVIAGMIFESLVARKVLPENPNTIDLPVEFNFWTSAREGLSQVVINTPFFVSMIKDGITESRMVLRWIFFGVVLAGIVKTFVDTQSLQNFFGPTLAGLGLTVLVATILEVCSEGSTPVAADLLNRAGAPGNSFAFLMTGVATDYTEIMILKETTRSWKFALFLPLITLPQVIVVAFLLNLATAF